ncbi:MAG: indole-3-glycerol-phosphate synthase TrpC, partial [Deinococcus-Thermus bacterium]|nr:indole-3-glycerol-phosphate synthase TrpC [Deinococcota bacterium]
MADTLDRILETKREHVAAAKALWPRASLEAELGDDETRDFEGALAEDIEDNGLALIAEIKKASPSKGLIRSDFDPASLASAYEAGGASCLSVLTDRPYFQGDDQHLKQARAACALPVLRKDFIVDSWQVMESRVIGADAILVILAAIDDDGLALDLVMEARDLDMAALVEVHDETEMDRALALPSPLIGINNRNLKTLEIDL